MSSMIDDFRRPVPLALAALAIVGWLIVGYFWSQIGDLRLQMEDGQRRAEVARQSLAADLQNLQKQAGMTAELKKQADAATKTLADSIAARASAQNDLTELGRQINDAKLVVSGAQEEATVKARELDEVEAQLKAETEKLNQAQGQMGALETQQNEAQAAVAAARAQQNEAQAAVAPAQAQLADLRRQIEDATRALDEIKAQTNKP